MNKEQAIELINQDKEERAKRCLQKIESVLLEERCTLNIAMLVTADKSIPQVSIIALD